MVVRVTVYGHTGTVGRVLYEWLVGEGLEPKGVSLDRQDEGADDCDWAFVCVPTPTCANGTQDQSAVYSVAQRLAGRPVNVVIRSTVLPGTCDLLQRVAPEWTVYHWPEFLSARSAERDFAHPQAHIVGCTETSWQAWDNIWTERLPCARTHYVSLATAEIIKYAHNCHGAMQVVFANLLWDACARVGASYGLAKATLPHLGHMGRETVKTYWDIHQDGYRGYGGACFPKDVAALRAWLGDDGKLLQGVEAANARLRGEG